MIELHTVIGIVTFILIPIAGAIAIDYWRQE